MKVRNLYIWSIEIIKNIEWAGFGKTCVSWQRQRTTILYKPFDGSRDVKDIIYGGKYHIGLPNNEEVRVEFADNLNSRIITQILSQNGYTKNHISKKKLAKILGKSIEENNN